MRPSPGFFDEQREQSQVKASIVQKYFSAWSKIMINRNKATKIAYIDLFAGPGRYQDGSKSTPILILENAVGDPMLRDRLVSIFNDNDAKNCHSLQNAIAVIPGIESLSCKPQVLNQEVGTEIVRQFERMKLVPTLFFVDPWEYKGLSLRLVNSVVKDFGCECVFFFNYNRINMGLSNEFVREHMEALFGENKASELRNQLSGLDPKLRELQIIEALVKALQALNARYVLPFRFVREDGNRTSHYLIFVTKHVRGYEIMKEIMAREGVSDHEGVPSFEYVQATREQQLLFEFVRPLNELKDMLLKHFVGQTLTMRQVYERHLIGKPFIRKNYKDALLALEESGWIGADPARVRRPNGTFADRVRVSFSRKE